MLGREKNLGVNQTGADGANPVLVMLASPTIGHPVATDELGSDYRTTGEKECRGTPDRAAKAEWGGHDGAKWDHAAFLQHFVGRSFFCPSVSTNSDTGM